MTTIALLGAGSWGTAVALHCAKRGHDVLLWAHDKAHVTRMQTKKQNAHYLPGQLFPDNLHPHHDLGHVLNIADEVIIAVPSHAFEDVFLQINHQIGCNLAGISWITKGINPKTNAFLSDIITMNWGEHFPYAILSGPSFAKEVANHLPTAVTIASNDEIFGQKLQTLLNDETFRVYLSDDTVGVQLCGAVKNVLAIATGVSDGLGFGANSRAALITRGLREMTRLGLTLGAHQETFAGLAGLGDLVLTCTDNQSRNRRFGLALGHGSELNKAERAIGQVVEGKLNAKQVHLLAKNYKIEMPICEQVSLLVDGKIKACDIVTNLMQRPVGHE
jgi:glycerol-3-phosphate dehydrogenase (NAD(P)+)